MKKIFHLFLITLVSAITLTSCEKEETKEVFLGGSTPQLKASLNGAIPLSFLTENNVAVTFSWTNPEYNFASGISSQDVSYTLEVDVAGKSFKGATKKTISISKDLSVTYTQKELNIVLSDLQLKLNTPASIDVRVIASIGSAATTLASNPLTFNVTPYAPPPKVPIPAQGNLWVVGDAFLSGWNNPLPDPFVNSQKFTRVSETLYELQVAFKGGGAYKMLQDNGVWGTQYHMVEGDATGGVFQKKDSDPAFVGPSVAGNYKIVVDFQTGRFTVTKL
jgi:hypothetical protein